MDSIYSGQDGSIEHIETKMLHISKVEKTMNLCILEKPFFLPLFLLFFFLPSFFSSLLPSFFSLNYYFTGKSLQLFYNQRLTTWLYKFSNFNVHPSSLRSLSECRPHFSHSGVVWNSAFLTNSRTGWRCLSEEHIYVAQLSKIDWLIHYTREKSDG